MSPVRCCRGRSRTLWHEKDRWETGNLKKVLNGRRRISRKTLMSRSTRPYDATTPAHSTRREYINSTVPSLTMLKTQGSFCFPMSLLAQHWSCPKSASRLGVYSRMLDRPESDETSRDTKAVSRPVDSVQWNFTLSGSASTWQFNVAGCSRETITISGLDRRHIGASVEEWSFTKNVLEIIFSSYSLAPSHLIELNVK